MTILLIAVALGAFFMSIVLTLVVISFSKRHGLVDSPGSSGHTKNLRSVPNTGGVAIFLTITIPVILALLVAFLGEGVVTSLAGEDAAQYTHGLRGLAPGLLALVIGTAIVHVMGLIDDRKAVPAWPKLLVMVAVSAALVLISGERLFSFLDTNVGGPWLSQLLTILWIVIVMNAINFMDNMDGVAAGVTTIVASAIFATVLIGGEQWKVGILLALLIGACAGFLVFNFPRASIFMGDSGSLVIGLVLGYITIRATYFGATVQTPWYSVFLPLVLLAVPLYDFLSVVIIRIAQGKSPMVGDQQHFGHRLRAHGLSDKQVWVVMCGATAVTGVSGIVLWGTDSWIAALVPVQVALVLTLIAVYEHSSSVRVTSRADASPTTDQQE